MSPINPRDINSLCHLQSIRACWDFLLVFVYILMCLPEHRVVLP